MNQRQIIDISTSTLFRFILILLALIFLYFIRDILAMLFVALVIVAAVDSPVGWLKKHKIPRVVGVLIVYLLLFIILALIISLILPLLANEIRELGKNMPSYLERLGTRFQALEDWWQKFEISGNEGPLAKIGSQLAKAASSVFATTIGIFGGLISALVILIISIYLAVQEKGIKKFFMSITPPEHQAYMMAMAEKIQIKMGGWLWGQLFLALIVAILTFLGLSLLGVPYALILALLAGLLEVVPYLGPIIASIPAIIIAFLQSPFLALLTLILYIVIQQVENYIIVPQVMRRAVGLNPVVIIIAMLIGVKIAGILGLILAVPIAAIISVFLEDFMKQQRPKSL